MNYSKITEDLYIGTTPSSADYDELRKLGVGLVINMRIERRPYPDRSEEPMETLWLPTFDSPLVPIPIRALHRGAEKALETIGKGEKVYVHCAQGIHRGVAMGAAILIAQGCSPDEAIALIEERRRVADPRARYIERRIRRFAEKWEDGKV
jgi:protein-tyrosine phosphatase